MNFNNFLNQIAKHAILNEADGSAMAAQLETAKAGAGDNKAKDAARKKVERSRQVPRDKKPAQELIKDVILVKTNSGNVQLIFKDSFNKGYHQKLNKQDMTVDEAKRATQEKGFEQTRASKLLFGNVKQGSDEKDEKSKNKEETSERKSVSPKSAEETEKSEKTKAKKMDKEQMFQTMTQMTPEQLLQMPPELRNQYFQMMRQPTPNSDFDELTYEKLTVAYGLSDISGVPYNQQVLNAVVFLAKIKAGASEQEMQTYLALAPGGREFTRTAFFTARKILSQIGDQCLQTLLTNVETTGKPVNSEGASDMECGEYRFKVAAGGEIAFSSTDFNQSNKNFKGFVANALTQALSNPELTASDPRISETLQKTGEIASQFSEMLVPDNAMSEIRKDPEMLKKLQNTPIKDASGQQIGTVVDEEGNLNPLASMINYQKAWEDGAYDLLKGKKDNPLKKYVSSNLLKTMLRGDGIVPPETAPNHLITVNGILPMTDDYFDSISNEATLDVKRAKDVMTASNIQRYNPTAAEQLKKFTTVVEAAEPQQKKMGLKDILVDKTKIDPMQIMVGYITKNNDFSLNASLLPGFKPKDLNAIQYNYITVDNKTTKIPVMTDDNVTNQVLGEQIIMLNDLLVEALTNNFVLANLVNYEILNDSEGALISNSRNMLLEDSEYVMINMKSIFENAKARIQINPLLLNTLIKDFIEEEYERDYKKEYKNYHGKSKQRKERASRTKAREEMIKKGRAKRGDGKDIDHKKAIRSGGSNGINNLRVRDRSANRSDNGHHKGEKQNKDSWK